ncbi:FtsX-like permease family protein [Uniformispora flossi]|uniref:FtsX-like permease family protein n=1 Tax=Uniformispora flossi TaxID=3390723 RepID=UPI003C2B0719
MTGRGWRAALRIARREAWRAKGRSLLIVLMVALPVFGASAADVTYRSQQLDTGERLARQIGRADARLTEPVSDLPIAQDPVDDGRFVLRGDLGPAAQPQPRTDVRSVLPPGAAVLTDTVARTTIRTGFGLAGADWREFDYDAPIAHGIAVPTGGRAPRAADEVAVTDRLLRAGGLKIGGTLTEYNTGRVFRIVGTVKLPDHLDARQVFALPAAGVLDAMAGQGRPTERKFLVDAPDGAYTWDRVRALNDRGIVVLSRAVAEHPPPDDEVPYLREGGADFRALSDMQIAVGVVVVGMALLEVVLLAGPAFAVGARRRRRDFGLVAVVGGDRRHIRTIVLADGAVLGGVAGVLGTGLGSAAAWFARGWFSSFSGKELGHFDVRPLELAGIAALGMAIGLVSAAIPAVLASRESVAASLTGRRGVRRGSRVLPVAGVLLGAAGVAVAYYGAKVAADDTVLLTGCVVAELGVIACCPALLGLAARCGRVLPLTPRLALRDAARNRPRTAPAVAAVMAALAGATSVTAYWASTDHDARADYRAQARQGQVLATNGYENGRGLRQAADILAASLPVSGPGLVRGYRDVCAPNSGCLTVSLQLPAELRCPLDDLSGPGAIEAARTARTDPRCQAENRPSIFGLPVGDPETVRRITGSTGPEIADALRTGAVVFDRRYVKDGMVTVAVRTLTPQDTASPTTVSTVSAAAPPPAEPAPRLVAIPARYVAPAEDIPALAVLGEEAARAIGVPPGDIGILFDTVSMPSEADEQRARAQLDGVVTGVYFDVERGYQGRPSTQLLLLAAATVVVALGAAGVATGLALADGRRDLATLGAVGAPPRVRRALSAAQSWVIALVGTVLGLAVGLLPAAALRWRTAKAAADAFDMSGDGAFGISRPDVPLVVPWAEMGLALLVVPLLAAVVAAVCTRTRVTVGTRAG